MTGTNRAPARFCLYAISMAELVAMNCRFNGCSDRLTRVEQQPRSGMAPPDPAEPRTVFIPPMPQQNSSMFVEIRGELLSGCGWLSSKVVATSLPAG